MLVWIALGVGSAWASGESEEAEVLFQLGLDRYQAGRIDEARPQASNESPNARSTSQTAAISAITTEPPSITVRR